jgi:hypothetical protein
MENQKKCNICGSRFGCFCKFKTMHENKSSMEIGYTPIGFSKQPTLIEIINSFLECVLKLDRFTNISNGEMLEDLYGEYVLMSDVLALFSSKK